MNHLRLHVKEFQKELSELNGSNTVLSGSCVLEAYGLNTGKLPGDLDLIIYNPTKSQIEYIKLLRSRDVMDKERQIEEHYKKVISIMSAKGLKMDIVFESYNIHAGEHPRYHEFKLQPIDRIIQAKRRFNRPKDLEAFLDLKQLNFNRK